MIVTPAIYQIVVVIGAYVLPAYQNFKALEKKTDPAAPQQIRDWCTYWVVLALFTTFEWVLDLTIFWLPLYYDAKAFLVIALWHPRFKLATQGYERYIAPLLRANQGRIDHGISAAQTHAMELASNYATKAKTFLQRHAGALGQQLMALQQKALHAAQAKTGRAHQQ